MPSNYLKKYVKFFSVQTGGAPRQEKLEWAIRQTLTENDLQLFFLLPFSGSISSKRLERKAQRKGFSLPSFQDSLSRLHQEGFVISYDKGAGRVYERAFVSFTVEQQVRRRQGTEVGAAYGEFWDGLAELTDKMPSKTPYFRVMPVESSLPGKDRNIPLHIEISDPREVLPIDIITEMVRREPLIGVSECYCRLARENRGDGTCEHIRETCFTFNELAQTLIETGLAREVDASEAEEILVRAEEDGLIHNVDNCQGELKALCNCCSCCCPAVQSYQRGVRNVNASSRYQALLIPDLCPNCGACVEICPVGAIYPGEFNPEIQFEECIGCGHCVTLCPEGAIHMSLREEQERIPRTNDQLWGNIRREAIISMLKDKLFPW